MTEIRLPARARWLVDGAPDVARLPCDRLLDAGNVFAGRLGVKRPGTASTARG
jgi:hypothetical protein